MICLEISSCVLRMIQHQDDDDDDDDDDEDDDDDDEDDGDDDDDETFTEGKLNEKKGRNFLYPKGTLKNIVKNIGNRDKNSYSHGNIKNMKKDKLIEIALTCQGKRVCSIKTNYKYRTNDEIESMDEKQLREMFNEMANRDPGTFRYSESSWTRDKLTHFILTCQGSSKPRDLGSTSFVGGGWCL